MSTYAMRGVGTTHPPCGSRFAALCLPVPESYAIRHHIAAAALLLAISGCEGVGTPARVTVPPDSAAGEISFRLAGIGGAAIAVPVYINGKGPIDLVLDTGATLTCVDEALARKLGLPERIGAIGVGASVGGTGPLRLVRIDSLRVGGASASGITACALDLKGLRTISPDVHGLLGLNFLKSFRVTINFKRHVLTLAAP